MLGPGNISFEECVSEAWEARTAGQATLGWTSADVYYYIKQQIQALNKSRMTSPDTMTFNNCHPSSFNNRSSLGMMQPLASKWGLDKLYRWKLSKEFAQAYPFLDCTGGKSNVACDINMQLRKQRLTINICSNGIFPDVCK